MIVGLIPAAGHATRMLGLPKMLLPTPEGALIAVLRDRMKAAGARQVVVGTRRVIADLIPTLEDAETCVYRVETETMSETVLMAREVIDPHATILFGMPDTYLEDDYAFPKLTRALERGADVAVGVFKTRPGQHRKVGMVSVRASKITSVVDKPTLTDLIYCWGVLAWRPAFWGYLRASDPHVGYALPHAIADGLHVRAVPMSGGYYDCGTVAEYFELIRHLTEAPPCT